MEAGVWHLRATHPFRGVMDIETGGGVKFRRFVVWSLDGKYGNVRGALIDAMQHFECLFGRRPAFAFMRTLPRGVEWFTQFEGMLLLDAEWMLERCVAVGGMTPLSLTPSAATTSPQMRTSTFGGRE